MGGFFLDRLKRILTHRILTHYAWFYLALIFTAGVSFWAGIQYQSMQSTQSKNESLISLLKTETPSWMKSLKRSSSKKSLGNPDASVKIVEYTDLECPYCRRYSKRVLPKIVDNYVRNGKVYYTVRHFPLPKRIHPNALLGAIASECAANQGKFWKFKTLAMKNRRYQSEDLFLALAEAINVPDIEQFKDCLTKRSEEKTVRQEAKIGERRGVSGTPTVFINGAKVTGARPYSRYRTLIEKELKKESTSF